MTSMAGASARKRVLGPYQFERELSSDVIGQLWSARVRSGAQTTPGATIRRIVEGQPFNRQALDEIAAVTFRAMELDARIFLRAIDVVREEDELGLVLPALSGTTLRGILRTAAKRMHPVPEGVVARIALDLADQCTELARVAPDGRYLFGAVAPESVFVDRTGRARLIDLGASFVTARHALATRHIDGTAYLAPEHLDGSHDTRTDVFVLGLVVWEMLSARRPRQTSTFDALQERIRFRSLPNLSNLVRPRGTPVPRNLAAVVARAVHPSPARRFVHVREFAEAIASVPEPVMHAEAALMLGTVASSGVHRISLPAAPNGDANAVAEHTPRRHRGPLDTIPYGRGYSLLPEPSLGDSDERETLPTVDEGDIDDDIEWDVNVVWDEE